MRKPKRRPIRLIKENIKNKCYLCGSSVMGKWFKKAKRINPECKNYYGGK